MNSRTASTSSSLTPSLAMVRRATLGATVGSVVEWFDVAVYGYLAIVIGEVFFSTDDPTVALLSSFAVFGSAFLVRPLGGVFFGYFGDRLGRKKTLAAVIMLVSGATFCIGILPDYSTIGIFAPILLVLMRLVQGFSAGGEMGGASAFVAEFAPKNRRGFYVSLVEMGCILGFLLGSVTVLFLNLALPEEAVLAWGWRIPFLIAAPLGFIGFYIRSHLTETPEFQSLKDSGQISKNPLKEVLTKNWRGVLTVAGFALFQNVALYVILTYVPSHLTAVLGESSLVSSMSSVTTMTLICLTIPIMGLLSDRIGRKRLLSASAIAAVIASYPLFLLMEQGTVAAITAHALLGLILGTFLGPVLAAMNELFGTAVRYGGFSIGYNVSVSLFGGTAPFFVTFLVSTTGVSTSPGLVIIAAAIVTLIALWASSRKPRSDHETN